jgi:hypothetical protein
VLVGSSSLLVGDGRAVFFSPEEMLRLVLGFYLSRFPGPEYSGLFTHRNDCRRSEEKRQES